MKDHLKQGSQTQSVLRAAWDWKQGLAGRIKDMKKKITVNTQCLKK